MQDPNFGVMPALVAGIHVFMALQISEDVDGRDKPGHDGGWGEPINFNAL